MEDNFLISVMFIQQEQNEVILLNLTLSRRLTRRVAHKSCIKTMLDPYNGSSKFQQITPLSNPNKGVLFKSMSYRQLFAKRTKNRLYKACFDQKLCKFKFWVKKVPLELPKRIFPNK